MKIERPISFSPYGSPYRKPPDIFECSLWNTWGPLFSEVLFRAPLWAEQDSDGFGVSPLAALTAGQLEKVMDVAALFAEVH